MKPGDKVNVSKPAYFLGSSASGLLEIAIFHPFDTAGKRLMSNQTRIFGKGLNSGQVYSKISEVIFKAHNNEPFYKKYISLYQGVNAALGYKVSQRIYRFAGQPILSKHMDTHYRSSLEAMFGAKYCQPITHAICGAVIGVGEMLIVPLDVLKIKRQTNPEALKGRGMLGLIRTEGFGLYQGASWTATRNGPGSFALFGGAAFAKEVIFGLEDYNKATLWQNFVSSIVGSLSCIIVANPADVVKTRVQNKDFGAKVSGLKIAGDMIREEGIGAFSKGFTPKLIVVGPKLIFAFTSAQTLIARFNDILPN
mmetsp:Transcript_35075/g.68855  ORF Transcript_35075/g.68855 Transcript_35075/m.68855 type:complete len:309 (+) Transcript_35075:112-1038(+)|eukprot:CAMPEP_0175140254 /NCGR_PEP_ID=MMETSP0087-20121206/11363_1 /TAXON_ID=136419 /ORGANISM="Unknown Unknown, Strain D1" /LENGTH=308 /DNA_ID=CAMNT_0016423369 /DNA_START=36 /DNA_END=962 /DNA_ORIENTATION=+